ncbi:hydrolase [Peribacillus simplex NBRC 15720 = DSM 1321]|uniref:Hydrolase n=2 Tax=Peribacillus simplex TaxID=1478 RepID=A0A223EJ83_9BACI|nr:amidohydrolase [Peribacillus simplex]ASS95155.1 hydrolase [Peribacillus simplex NBRC 15720 = DSM 1321]MEC1397818.1 amidohydrolase [Peribacillus simplex]MED3910673.1 amidohydrolase [Peribacillus simplex]
MTKSNVELENYLLEFRRDLHMTPELSNQEFETTKKIKEALQSQNIKILDFSLKTGVVAEIKGSKPGPTIALRSDIDALPILEQSEVDFPSTHVGVMHACGHDFHTSVILGTAFLLKKEERDLSGTIRLIFQPAEETGHGASALMETGVLDDVDVIFGLHNDPTLKVGELGTKHGALTAGVDRFEVHVKATGSHAAKPEEGNDPIIITGHIISTLQTIISRNVAPKESAVLSITQIHSGSTWNVIPDSAYLEGTVRTFSKTQREFIQKRMKQVLHGISETFNANVELSWHPGPPSVDNTPEWADLALQVGDTAGYTTKTLEASSIGEDFAFYQEKIPGAFVMIGSGGPYDLHHPKFIVDETALFPAASYFRLLALEALKKIPK